MHATLTPALGWEVRRPGAGVTAGLPPNGTFVLRFSHGAAPGQGPAAALEGPGRGHRVERPPPRPAPLREPRCRPLQGRAGTVPPPREGGQPAGRSVAEGAPHSRPPRFRGALWRWQAAGRPGQKPGRR